jgi:hypothetical protein
MFYMILAAVEAILAFVVGASTSSNLLQGYFRPLAPIVSSPYFQLVNEVLSLSVLVLSPVVLVSVSRTWTSLSGWRRSFLRFAIMSNIESVAFEAEDPGEMLFQAIIAANPDYERILNKTARLLQSERSDAGIRWLPKDMFRNVTIGHKRRAATFDVLIGFPPRKMSKTSIVSANQLLKTRTVSNALRALSSIGITAGRVFDGKPSIRSYIEFAEDLKLLSSYAGSAVMRGFLVYKETPQSELLYYANNKNNWPRHQLIRIPIVVLVQQEKGYEVVVLAS